MGFWGYGVLQNDTALDAIYCLDEMKEQQNLTGDTRFSAEVIFEFLSDNKKRKKSPRSSTVVLALADEFMERNWDISSVSGWIKKCIKYELTPYRLGQWREPYQRQLSTELFRKKDLRELEKTLRAQYSRRHTSRFFFLPSKEIPIINSLDPAMEDVDLHRKISKAEEEFERRIGFKK